MKSEVVKICDLWRGRVFSSPQPARVYWTKGISPAIQSDRSGGSREIKFMVIDNEKRNGK